MKCSYILIISGITLLNFNSCQWNKVSDKKETQNYTNTKKSKYTGEKRLYWKNNKTLKAIINYKDGKREGISKNYSPNGKLQSIVPFSNNMINGESKQFYLNGNLHSTIYYVNDAKHGPEKWYYEEGGLYQETNYVHGNIQGKRKKYYKNGKLMSVASYKNGKPGIGLKEYNEDGTLKEMPYIVVQEVDNLQSTGEYIIKYRLSNKTGNTKFYTGDLEEGKYFVSDLSPVHSVNGIGKSVINLQKGTFIMYTVNVIARSKTKFRNEYLTQKKVNIAIEHR